MSNSHRAQADLARACFFPADTRQAPCQNKRYGSVGGVAIRLASFLVSVKTTPNSRLCYLNLTAKEQPCGSHSIWHLVARIHCSALLWPLRLPALAVCCPSLANHAPHIGLLFTFSTAHFYSHSAFAHIPSFVRLTASLFAFFARISIPSLWITYFILFFIFFE